MTIYTIYRATNKINGKMYIGFDSKWPRRRTQHKQLYENKDTYFYRAIRKNGWENFEWDIIYQEKEDITDLSECNTLTVMEPLFIREYNTCVAFENSNGYNLTIGGEGVVHNEIINAKKKKKYLDNFGYDNPFKCPEIKEKAKTTKITLYGSYINTDKMRETKLERYGNKNYNNREKAEETWIEIYGVKNPSQSDLIKEKKKTTCFNNFGVYNSTQHPEIRKKQEDACFEKYGVKYGFFIEEICSFCNEIHPKCHQHQCKQNPNRNVYERSGSKNSRAIRISLNNIEYGTVKEAATQTKTNINKIRDYLKGRTNKMPDGVYELRYL
jgi:hypothetical protein